MEYRTKAVGTRGSNRGFQRPGRFLRRTPRGRYQPDQETARLHFDAVHRGIEGGTVFMNLGASILSIMNITWARRRGELGNVCRSPMVEGFASCYGSDVLQAESRGLAPVPHVPTQGILAMRDAIEKQVMSLIPELRKACRKETPA